MARLKVIKSGPLATIQDKGRFGYRQFGIPQSGAVDVEGMQIANQLVGNTEDAPVIEYAISEIELEVIEGGNCGLFGAALYINNLHISSNASTIIAGDMIKLSKPQLVYAYFSIGGKLQAGLTFGSYSTYLPGTFGGIQGRSLKPIDEIITTGKGQIRTSHSKKIQNAVVRFVEGPEWHVLKNPFERKEFHIDPSSNRIGIRLKGNPLKSSLIEIKSSAVIPGTIQLPPDGQPIVLMNDCQTTGGYPRIGKVLDTDLGTLSQLRGGTNIVFQKIR